MELFLKTLVLVDLKRTKPDSPATAWFAGEVDRLVPEVNSIWEDMKEGDPNPWNLTVSLFWRFFERAK